MGGESFIARSHSACAEEQLHVRVVEKFLALPKAGHGPLGQP